MSIITGILSLPVSVILILWILKMKKDEPFQKGIVLRTLILGALSTAAVTIFTIGIGFAFSAILLGPDNISALIEAFSSGDEAAATEITSIVNANKDNSFGPLFIRTFLTIGLIEEVFKFLVMRSSVRKIENKKTWLDVVFLGALAGLGFEIFEDITYSSGGLGITILRVFTPFHFVFGVLMGYLYGKALLKKSKIWITFSILAPALIHAIYDTSVRMLEFDDIMVFIMLGLTVLLMAAFVFEVIIIRKWNKTKELDALI